jgi:hypothetical protein
VDGQVNKKSNKGTHDLADFWKFDLKELKWTLISSDTSVNLFFEK